VKHIKAAEINSKGAVKSKLHEPYSDSPEIQSLIEGIILFYIENYWVNAQFRAQNDKMVKKENALLFESEKFKDILIADFSIPKK